MATRQKVAKQTGVHHVLATVKATGRSMVVAGLLTAIFAALAVETYGVVVTGSITTPSIHLFAVAFALACMYGAIVTVLLRGVIVTLVESLELLTGEVQRLAGGIAHEAESVLHPVDEYNTARATVESVASA